MLKMEQRHWEIIESILKKYPYQIAAFGSRARGNPKRFSDLDLCVMEPISDLVLGNMQEDFQESNIPFMVDIVVWNRCSKEFQESIKNNLLIVREK